MATKHERDLKGVQKIRAETAKEIEELWAIENKEGRQLEDHEREEILEKTKALDELRIQQDEIEANIALERKVKEASQGFAGDPDPVTVDIAEKRVQFPSAPERPKTLGEQFVESKAYQDVFGQGKTPQGEWKTRPVELMTKGTTSGGTIDAFAPWTQFVPGLIDIPTQPLVVADLMPNGVATSPTIQYFSELTATNAADAVGEKDLKPTSSLDFVASSQTLKKIATFLPMSDEMLEDAPQLMTYLNQRLTLFIRSAEENSLLRGQGTNDIEGFVDNYASNSVGSAVISGTAADNVGTAIFGDLFNIMNNQRGSSMLEPDAIVMHPTEFGTVRTRYDGDGQYYGGGPIQSQYGGPAGQAPSSRFATGFSLWGVPVHVTTAIGQGTILVGNFSQGAQVWRRGGVSVQATNSHDDFFAYNKTAIRAEERLTLTIYRPAAFTVVTWA